MIVRFENYNIKSTSMLSAWGRGGQVGGWTFDGDLLKVTSKQQPQRLAIQ